MSKKKIIDVLAFALIAVFLFAIYFYAPLKIMFLGYFCMLDQTSECMNASLLLYAIPMASAMWLVIRFFSKLTKNI